jgi:hypothetical protein
MKLKLTAKQMRMLLDKIGIPKGKVLTTTAGILDRIYQNTETNLFN